MADLEVDLSLPLNKFHGSEPEVGGPSPLARACAYGNLTAVKYITHHMCLCCNGLETVARGVVLACHNGHVPILAHLLPLLDGMIPRFRDDMLSQCMLRAAAGGRIDVIRKLYPLPMGGGVFVSRLAVLQCALSLAVSNGQIEAVRLILAMAHPEHTHTLINSFDVVSSVFLSGHPNLVKLWLSMEGARRFDLQAAEEVFSSACGSKNVQVVSLLLSLKGDRYIDVHADSEAAFRTACFNGSLNIVRLLLSLKGDRLIDVNARADERGMYGRADDAFLGACLSGNLALVQELLALDGDRKLRQLREGLLLAIERQEIDVVKAILQMGPSSCIDFSDSAVLEGLFYCLAGVNQAEGHTEIDFVRALGRGATSLFIALQNNCDASLIGTSGEGLEPGALLPAAHACAARVLLFVQGMNLYWGCHSAAQHLLQPLSDPGVDVLLLCSVLPQAQCSYLFSHLLQARVGAEVHRAEHAGTDSLAVACTWAAGLRWTGLQIERLQDPAADPVDACVYRISRLARRCMVLSRTAARLSPQKRSKHACINS